MVKFAKNGSDATTAAVKLARAATGRQHVAICRTQPFFSTDDWFIGTTPMRAGTLEEERRDRRLRLQRPRLGAGAAGRAPRRRRLRRARGRHRACAEPAPGFLEGLRELADERRLRAGLRRDDHRHALVAATGAQHVYGVRPDLSTWGKALGNGFAVSALAGRRELMELGGLRTDAPRVFLLSTTHGPETAGLAAYLAVERAYREWDVVGDDGGGRVAAGGRGVAEVGGGAGLGRATSRCSGRPSCLVFATRDAEGRRRRPFRTLFLQELIRRGVLGQSFVVSAAHTDADLDVTVEAVAGRPAVYRRGRSSRFGRRAARRPSGRARPCRAQAADHAASSHRGPEGHPARGEEQHMRVLVDGDRGYIGAVLVPVLQRGRARGRRPRRRVVRRLRLRPAARRLRVAHRRHPRPDARRTWPGFDAVVHLAAISNDPVGHLNPEATYSVNAHGAAHMARGRQGGGRAAVPVLVLVLAVRRRRRRRRSPRTARSTP